jgi:hypothetical protein
MTRRPLSIDEGYLSVRHAVVALDREAFARPHRPRPPGEAGSHSVGRVRSLARLLHLAVHCCGDPIVDSTLAFSGRGISGSVLPAVA